MTNLSDSQLLAKFAESRSEAAFAELVRRFVDLVYSVAWRMLVDPHLAEDVTQTVFAILAQNAGQVAGKVTAGAPLAGWLHVTARNVAGKTVRQEERRRTREREAAMQNTPDPVDSKGTGDWDEIAPQLDAALGGLRAEDRDLLVLRYFSRKSAREISQILRVSEEAAQKRVGRALERLRRGLGEQGAATSSGALAALLTANAVQAAPAGFAAGLAQASVASLTAGSALSLTTTATFKTAGTFAMSKMQIAALIALAAGFAVPLAQQQTILKDLRRSAALATASASVERPAAPAATTDPAEEIARLRQTAADLRSRLAARQNAPRQKPLSADPVLLAPDHSVSIGQFTYAGNATPEAALQSLLFFQRDSNLDGVLSLMLFPPSEATAWNQAVSNDETRKMLARNLHEELYGLTLSESVQTDENGQAVAPPIVKEQFPDNPSGEVTLKLKDKQALGERQVRLVAQFTRGAQIKDEPFTFGLTPAGWKRIP